MPQRGLRAELIAEFIGTAILMLFGQGVVAMVLLFGTGVPGEVVKGGFTNIVIGWGVAGRASTAPAAFSCSQKSSQALTLAGACSFIPRPP